MQRPGIADSPQPGVCSLCGQPAATSEARPSGPNLEAETWWFCRECFAELEAQRGTEGTPEGRGEGTCGH